jgi:transaldolase
MKTKFILDSGDVTEYKEIAALALEKGSQLWGSTTNPSLIAKSAGEQLDGKKLSMDEAFELQRKIVTEILMIVPGAVSAEVYADRDTTAEDMIKQGKEIARWDARVVVKVPTTIEGMKARTALRQESIVTNNTLVFSQEQIYAICLHEEIIERNFTPQSKWPSFISPFVGRINDQDFNGMDLVKLGMKLKKIFNASLWMLEASVRSTDDVKQGIALKSELITAPAKVYHEWFDLSEDERNSVVELSDDEILNTIPTWDPPVEMLTTTTLEDFYRLIESGTLNINHPMTESGIDRFVADWKAILQEN